MLDESTGVTAEASTAADSSASVDTGGQEASNPTVQGTDPGAPAQPVAENVSGADAGVEGFAISDEELAQAPEQWREKFKSLLGGYKSLEADHKPLKSWVDERGGMDYIRQDVEMVDKLFSDKIEDRQQAYATLYQDQAAWGRFMGDVVSDPMVQREVLQNIDPQVLLDHIEQAGLLPEGYGSNIDPAVLASIPAELQEVFRSLPIGVKEQYAEMGADARNWHLRRDAQLYNSQKAERERGERAKQHQAQARAQQVNEQKTKVYNDIRSILQSALADKIPGNTEATQFVLNATETLMLNDPESAALWNELSNHIENGEMRAVQQKLPLMLAKAKATAVKQAAWLNERESKARQFDELMRLGSQEDILRYLAQLRGGQKQPGPGSTPAPTNGSVPKPELRGQYDHANIISYGSRS